MWRYFFDEDPYLGFDPTPFPDDVHGWSSEDPVFKVVIDHVRPNLIVEVGTWKGRSAFNMARLCQELGLSTKIICIDTWLGITESYLSRSRRGEASLRFKHGWPQLYYQFLANVVRRDLQHMITPLPQTSTIAAQILVQNEIEPDLIYIDASHEYHDVKMDLVNFLSLLRSRGVLFGDDYLAWEGVTRAVREFSIQAQVPFWGRAGKFVFLKDGDARLIPNLQ